MSGHRKNVTRKIKRLARDFDRACRAVRIPWRHRLMYWLAYVRLARKGTLIHSPTRDAQYEEGPLKRRYDRYCEKINARLERAAPAGALVDVPSFEHGELELPELNLLMRLNVPFVIRGGIRHLPLSHWTLESLEEVAGSAAVPINKAPDRPSDDRNLPTKSHHYYDFHTGTLSDVAAAIRRGDTWRVSTAEDVMHHDGGRLREDLGIPYWEQVSGWEKNQHHWWHSRMMTGRNVGAQMMLQPENAFTLWHAESGDNFFCLVRGGKTWTLAHPYYTAALRPRVKKTTNYHGSNIDVREPDDVLRQRGYAGYLNIPKARVELHAGDVLRVPNHWWHTVVTHPGDYTIAATIRANCNLNRLGLGYTLLRARDEKYLEMARAWLSEGRIRDEHIGYPRPPREASTRPESRSETDSALDAEANSSAGRE